MDSFFRDLTVPSLSLSEKDRTELESPITLEELQQAMSEMEGQKSPGPDGLPVEIYRHYGKILLPELLMVLNWSVTGGVLLRSMMESSKITIHKEGKDPLDTASYRPIALLNSDVKMVATVLAARLNGVIQGLVHPHQLGFIPGRTTSINIRRVYLNLQVPTGGDGERAVLSLDAAKAFDTIEWQYLWRAMEAV